MRLAKEGLGDNTNRVNDDLRRKNKKYQKVGSQGILFAKDIIICTVKDYLGTPPSIQTAFEPMLHNRSPIHIIGDSSRWKSFPLKISLTKITKKHIQLQMVALFDTYIQICIYIYKYYKYAYIYIYDGFIWAIITKVPKEFLEFTGLPMVSHQLLEFMSLFWQPKKTSSQAWSYIWIIWTHPPSSLTNPAEKMMSIAVSWFP